MNRPIRAARNRPENENDNAVEAPVANEQENVQVDADRAFEELVANHAEQDPVEDVPARQQARQNRNPRQRRRNQPRPLAESSSSESDEAEGAVPAPLPEGAENPLRRAVRAKKEWLGVRHFLGGGFVFIISWYSPFYLFLIHPRFFSQPPVNGFNTTTTSPMATTSSYQTRVFYSSNCRI